MNLRPLNLSTFRLLSLIALLAAMTSCRHKDFCWDHPHGDIHIEVLYDDDNDPDDAAHLRDAVRATRLMAFHAPTGQSVMTSDMERCVNKLSLGEDSYHFIAYNAGTQSITFDGHDAFHTHSATTRTCDILEPFYESRGVKSDIDLANGEAVVIPAEPLWSVGGEAVACHVGDTVRLTAVPLHCRYTYEMRAIDGLGSVSRISSFITGMSRGAMLGTVDLHDTPVTVAVPARVDREGRRVTGSFICFGQNPRIDVRHRMGLFIEMDNGQRFMLLEGDHFDVTDQVTGAPNRRRVHIVIDGVRLPEPAEQGSGAGFDVQLNPWDEGENIDIDLGFGS